nr:SCAN domain-containing protein 1-like [Vicugna pacos]
MAEPGFQPGLSDYKSRTHPLHHATAHRKERKGRQKTLLSPNCVPSVCAATFTFNAYSDLQGGYYELLFTDLENPQRHLFQLAKTPELNRCHQRKLKCTRYDAASELRVNVQSASPTAAGQRATSRPGDTEATEPGLVTTGSPEPPLGEEERAGPNSVPERDSAGSLSTPEAPLPAPEPSSPNAAVPEANPTPPEAASAALELPLGPAPLGSAPLAEAALHSPPGPGGSWPGPETFRQRFQQFRYQDTAGPREAFRQLRELSCRWLRPDIRTKEQIVEMLVQERLLAILPEAARPRRLSCRTDVRITG